MPRVDQQPRVHELAWPQQMLLIGKLGSQPDRTGGLNNLVIDEVECALIELLAVLAIDEDGDRPPGHAFLDWNEVGLRQVKISEIGSIWVTSTRPFTSVGWMTLPISICLMPVTPSIGEVRLV